MKTPRKVKCISNFNFENKLKIEENYLVIEENIIYNHLYFVISIEKEQCDSYHYLALVPSNRFEEV